MAAYTAEVEASCAICGAPPFPEECPHEGERLEMALNQAMHKWAGYRAIRYESDATWHVSHLVLGQLTADARNSEWVVNHARDQVLMTFHELRRVRMDQHNQHMQSLPYHTLYHRYNGRPPLAADQIQQYHIELQRAEAQLKQLIDQDWKSSCLQYPDILDYYFSLVDYRFPSERDPSITDPRFGATEKARPRQEVRRRTSMERPDHRRRSSRERRLPSPTAAQRYRLPSPPTAPMPPRYR